MILMSLESRLVSLAIVFIGTVETGFPQTIADTIDSGRRQADFQRVGNMQQHQLIMPAQATKVGLERIGKTTEITDQVDQAAGPDYLLQAVEGMLRR